MSFHSYMVVLCAPIPIWDRELLILDPVACVMAFKLHGEGIRGSQALSIAYRDERQMNLSYMVLLGMWNMFGQKLLSFIVGWAGATEPPAHNKLMTT